MNWIWKGRTEGHPYGEEIMYWQVQGTDINYMKIGIIGNDIDRYSLVGEVSHSPWAYFLWESVRREFNQTNRVSKFISISRCRIQGPAFP